MEVIINTTFLGLIFGILGTTLGGILGTLIKTKSNKFLSFILEFAAGLMVSIVCFDLIPEAIEFSNMLIVIFGVIIGVGIMIFCDNIVNYKYSKKPVFSKNSLVKTGIIVGIGLAIHNFPEGLAIGSGFGASDKLGYTLAIAIALHDIPEGISMAVPMKNGGMNSFKVILYTFLSGVTTGFGAFLGIIVGTISEYFISLCLGFAAGAMLYIVSGELMPEAHKIYKGRTSYLGNILGFIIGVVFTQI